MKKKIESLSTNFYDIKYNLEDKGSNYFVGEALVIRKDTEEETRYSCVKYGSDVNDIEKTIFDSISKISVLLSTKPSDWSSNSRKLLVRLNRLQQYETGFVIGLGSNDKNGKLDEFLQENYGAFLNHILEETKSIILGIESLDQEERGKLLFSDEEVYKNPSDAWNLDDLSLRNQIFKFFIAPSTEEIKLHTIHADRFKRLYQT